ncbi:hypothetical protein, partial [Klebsiella pneumoniae]|uniref:hypothetical protein n=1 Tax=Klebsiella pneumoniae TaxID=573 RepID=UPI0019535582
VDKARLLRRMAATPYPAYSSLVARTRRNAPPPGKSLRQESHKAEAVSASELTQNHTLTADPVAH